MNEKYLNEKMAMEEAQAKEAELNTKLDTEMQAMKEGEDLKGKISILAELRETQKQLDQQYYEVFQRFQEQNKDLIESRENMKKTVGETEQWIRQTALEIYGVTHEKKLAGGIGIKIMTQYNYEEQKAYDWAIEHNMALALDKKAFESIVKIQKPEQMKTNGIDFVEILEKPIATIPKEIKL